MARRPKRKPPVTVGEILLWLLFFALLVPAGVVGWAIGNATSGGGAKTVTVTVAAATTAPTTTTAAAPTTTAAATTTAAKPAAAGNAAQGKALFTSLGCTSCHTFKPAGSTGTVGPNLDTRPAQDAKKAHMALAAFVRQSIVAPNAFIAPGYPKGLMPSTFASLPKAKLDALVAFLTGGK